MRISRLNIKHVKLGLTLPICTVFLLACPIALCQDASQTRFEAALNPDTAAKLAKQVTVYAGPETVPPNADIYIDVEVHKKDGLSLEGGRNVTLFEKTAGADKTWTEVTKYGLARFVIVSGQTSGDRVFRAHIDDVVSKPVAVFVTSGEIETLPVRTQYDAVTNSLILKVQPIKDKFGNTVEDGTLITLTTQSESGETGLISAPLIDGRAEWSLFCARYTSGIRKLSLTVKKARKVLKNDPLSCAMQATAVGVET